LTNPSFIWRRIVRGIRTGEFFWDAYYGIKFASLPATGDSKQAIGYYAKDRWPRHDYLAYPLVIVDYQKAIKRHDHLLNPVAATHSQVGAALGI
jgi:hypothetical protein